MRAFFLRYPNPQAAHVLTTDVIGRRLEERAPAQPDGPPRMVLCTSRLLLKQGSLPRWAPKNIIAHSTSWVLEESEVELTPRAPGEPRVMSIWTRNLDHTAVMAVTESLKFTETPEVPGAHPLTLCQTRAQVASEITFRLLRRRIEKFGLKRYLTHVESSREGILWTLQRLAHRRDPSHFQEPVAPARSRRQRLLHALRPPFLDGDPPSPRQWAQKKWRAWRARWWGAPAENAPRASVS